METTPLHLSSIYVTSFPAYLQGMETGLVLSDERGPGVGSQPTYKEWKLS